MATNTQRDEKLDFASATLATDLDTLSAFGYVQYAPDAWMQLGRYTMLVTFTRGHGLVKACDDMDINLKGATVYLSAQQRYALIEDHSGIATVLDASDNSAHYFPSHDDAREFISKVVL